MQHFDNELQQIISQAIREDIGGGDHTTLCCIPKSQMGRAELKIKQNGILAGITIAEKAFRYISPNCVFIPLMTDGEAMVAGQIAFRVEAPVHHILSSERIVLNIMQRMCGIATHTHKFVDKIKDYPTKLLDTRKTTPNFRLLEKEAVRIGGGHNHRFGLYDRILLKDNHIDYCGGIAKAIVKAFAYNKENELNLPIEVETRTLEDVEIACKIGEGKVDRIMFDNFTPDLIGIALKMVSNKFETEASGGINLENIESYAATGVDFISVGGLIHQAQSIDLSLKAVIF